MIDEWFDNDFFEVLYDTEGNPKKVLKDQTSKKETSSGFTTYDTKYGHCGLCGKITCRGTCFK